MRIKQGNISQLSHFNATFNFYMYESLLFFKENENLVKDYYYYNAKCIREKNSNNKFRLKLRNFRITKVFYNITEYLGE